MIKRKRTSRGGAGSFLFGILLSFGILIALAIIASIFLVNAKSPTKNLGAVSLLIFVVSAILSGFINSRRSSGGEILPQILSALAFSILILVISLIAAGGRLGGVHLMNGASYIMAASLAAFIGRKRQRRRKRH